MAGPVQMQLKRSNMAAMQGRHKCCLKVEVIFTGYFPYSALIVGSEAKNGF